MIRNPEAFLRFQDMFRLTGHRENSGFAIGCMRLGGIIGILYGLFEIIHFISL